MSVRKPSKGAPASRGVWGHSTVDQSAQRGQSKDREIPRYWVQGPPSTLMTPYNWQSGPRSNYPGPAAPPLSHTAQRPVLQEAALQTLDRSPVSAEDSTWLSTELPGVCPHHMISAIKSWVWRLEVTGLPRLGQSEP